ncbi:MAG: hypothetical protein WC788_06590 [Candidatus Paceibacterota bacterium]|jgi:Mn2+/Fe2+ NRAMP family transporter
MLRMILELGLFIFGIASLIVGISATEKHHRLIKFVGIIMGIAVIFFSGALYSQGTDASGDVSLPDGIYYMHSDFIQSDDNVYVLLAPTPSTVPKYYHFPTNKINPTEQLKAGDTVEIMGGTISKYK